MPLFNSVGDDTSPGLAGTDPDLLLSGVSRVCDTGDRGLLRSAILRRERTQVIPLGWRCPLFPSTAQVITQHMGSQHGFSTL